MKSLCAGRPLSGSRLRLYKAVWLDATLMRTTENSGSYEEVFW